MFTEFHHISLLGMSNPELFIVKEHKKQIELEVSSRPTSEFPDGCQFTASNEPELNDHQEHDIEEDEKCGAIASSEKLKSPSFGDFEVPDHENDDGFRTPTSLDQKIPVITQCPPAPKKLRPQPSTKRKVPPLLRRSLPLDLSKEVESVFPPPLQQDLGRKIKKARRDDTE